MLEEDAASSGAIPDPRSDQFSWLYTGMWTTSREAVTLARETFREAVDFKTRRRLNQRLRYSLLVEAGSTVTNAPSLSFYLRMLVMLP